MKENFEQQLKHKLTQREITPAANAWERVQLQRGRKHKKNNTIYYVAASVALLIGLFWTATRQSDLPANRPGHTPVVTAPQIQTEAKSEPAVHPAPLATTTPSRTTTQSVIAQADRKASDIVPAAVQPEIPQAAIVTAPVGITPAIASVEHRAEIDYNDVDALIAKARMELAAGRGLSNPTDATTLLRDSESELDRNFRHSVIEYLFKQKKIKLAFDK